MTWSGVSMMSLFVNVVCFEGSGLAPQAPWTKNCSMKPEAARDPNLLGRTQAGIRQAEIRAATHIARLRPTHCER
jgi:hypothetical protein